MVPRPPADGVAVIDTTTNSVITGIPLGQGQGALAIALDGAIYATDPAGDTVQVIDPTSNTIAARIPVDAHPGNIAITPDGLRVYVSINDRSSGNSELSVIDAMTNTVTGTTPMPNSLGSIAITPDGKRAYVMNFEFPSVMVVDLAMNSVIDMIPLALLPGGIAVTPDGRFVYAVSYSDFVVGVPPEGNVSVIDVATDTITATIFMDMQAFGIAIGLPPSPPTATPSMTATTTATPTVTPTQTPTTTATSSATPFSAGGGGCSLVLLSQRDLRAGLWNPLMIVAVLLSRYARRNRCSPYRNGTSGNSSSSVICRQVRGRRPATSRRRRSIVLRHRLDWRLAP